MSFSLTFASYQRAENLNGEAKDCYTVKPALDIEQMSDFLRYIPNLTSLRPSQTDSNIGAKQIRIVLLASAIYERL